MLALLAIYKLAVLASAALGAALATLGCHLAARDRAMQTLCVSQGAVLGALLGLGIGDAPALPLVLALATGAGAFFAAERLVRRVGASRNTHFAALFATLLAAGYLASALFPALETHLAQRYFGDLATLGEAEAAGGLAFAVASLLLYARVHRSVSRASFETAVFGRPSVASGPLQGGAHVALALALVCLSVQTVGFLFTIACLFLPTALLARRGPTGLDRHVVLSAVVGALGAASGFLASLAWPSLPTVPTVVLALAASALIAARLPNPMAPRH